MRLPKTTAQTDTTSREQTTPPPPPPPLIPLSVPDAAMAYTGGRKEWRGRFKLLLVTALSLYLTLGTPQPSRHRKAISFGQPQVLRMAMIGFISPDQRRYNGIRLLTCGLWLAAPIFTRESHNGQAWRQDMHPD